MLFLVHLGHMLDPEIGVFEASLAIRTLIKVHGEMGGFNVVDSRVFSSEKL